MAKQSTQHKLDRVRAPRVQITYDVEVGGAIEIKELPFVMGVMGDFTGMPNEPLAKLKERKFVEVTPDNFDQVLENMKPHLAFAVENKLSEDPDAPKLKVDLNFKSLDDFAPEAVARQVGPLRQLLELRDRLSDLRGSMQGNDKLEELLRESVSDKDKLEKLRGELGKGDPMSDAQKSAAAPQAATEVVESGLLDQIVDQGRLARDPASRERGKNLVKEFVSQVLEGAMTVSKDAEAMINARIAQIDHLVSLQLNEVLHNPIFQKLEGSWRGLKYLLDHSETSDKLKIKVLNVSKKELLRDLQRAPEFDQSALFKKVYEEEFGVFGGAPFSALIGDYEFGRGPEEIELLEKIAQVASAAHAPFLSAAGPEMLNLESFTAIDAPRDMAKIFDSSEYAKWKSFRQNEDSRYVGLTLPHILMRLPYGRGGASVDGFNYEEGVDGTDHSKYLWGNAAYSLGTRLTAAHAEFGWCAAIRGVEGGGLVEGLPTHNFTTDSGDVALKCPTESPITDRREKELADLGFVPLVHCKDTDYAAFFSVQSAQKAKLYDKESANANARLSTQLPYILAMSRFAHYLKAIMRDKIGSFMSRDDCQKFLHKWIMQYTIGDDSATQAMKAKFPLREAKVEVVDVPGKPGAYRAVCFLRPHFQLDELSVSLRLVADLPESK